ncbi:unnamed protein product [Vicia faba]|uniref:Reverse transcriptase zinc-binding domain-containing protein n=1 Tax=Vicia faba TaxID=3906 RepID=A0AAV1ACN9_VICFA|nr:unnamed protein product [Vicia faba]
MTSTVTNEGRRIMELKVSSNISLYGWRLILNQIPTKDQLIYHGVVVDSSYILCGSNFESIAHLFGRCVFSVGIWNKMYDWIGSGLGMTVLELMELFFHFDKLKVKSERITISVIWLATVWYL